jgi:hypothetical protein
MMGHFNAIELERLFTFGSPGILGFYADEDIEQAMKSLRGGCCNRSTEIYHGIAL